MVGTDAGPSPPRPCCWNDGTENAPLAAELAKSFAVYNYCGRGRGRSGDTLPYALNREIEDLAALLAELRAGGDGPASLYGVSSGGALALEAAADNIVGTAVEKVVIYDVPYSTSPDAVRRWHHYTAALESALAERRSGDAVELFMQVAGSPPEQIAQARASGLWPGLEKLAPTLAYDAAFSGDGPLPVHRLASLRQPVLVATGGHDEFFEAAADATAASIPQAHRHVLTGQGHVVDPSVFAPVIKQFVGT